MNFYDVLHIKKASASLTNAFITYFLFIILAAVITIVAAIPKNSESIVAGKMNLPTSVNIGPAIMAAIAYLGGTFPGINSAVQSGINATELRSTIDIKLHPKIRSPRFPQIHT